MNKQFSSSIADSLAETGGEIAQNENKPRVSRRWSKALVVRAINERAMAGRALHHTWREDRPLFRAAANYFGNWSSAMRAAGQTPRVRESWSRSRVLDRLQVCEQRYSNIDVRTVDPRLAEAATRLFGSLTVARSMAGVEPPPRRWTKDRVVEAIQDRYVSGCPAQIAGLGDYRLFLASKRLFRSWEEAVAAAGLSHRITIQAKLRQWSQERVLGELQAWHKSGRSLADVSKFDQGLYCAAKKYFGTWRRAVTAAGLQPCKRMWSKQAVIDVIIQRLEQQMSLSSVQPENKSLVAVAHRYFGSWRTAIEAANLQKHQGDRRGA
jgi:hypothetical protein